MTSAVAEDWMRVVGARAGRGRGGERERASCHGSERRAGSPWGPARRVRGGAQRPVEVMTGTTGSTTLSGVNVNVIEPMPVPSEATVVKVLLTPSST